MDAIETIMSRRSVRDYLDTPVTNEAIETILKAAMAAPSGKNKQPWEFYVLKSEEARSAAKEVLVYARYNSPVMIIVGINQERTDAGISHDLAYSDASAACENILLAAKALGLDTVWCAIWPDNGRINGIRKALKLPFSIEPYALIHVGYAAKNENPKIKFDEEKIHVI